MGLVFLTGPTGFLGTQIARRLLRQTDDTIIALVRAGTADEAARQLSRTWWDWPELAGSIGGPVLVRCGDVALPQLGLSDTDYDDLVTRTTRIIHTAADLRLDAPIEELRRTNVQGVASVLALARAIHQDHGLARLSHVSTAYVCGLRSGPIGEDELGHEEGFGSNYEQSKYEGEILVQEAKETLPVSVFRPAMIVGDSQTGAVKTFNSVYFPLRLYLTGTLPVLPARRSLRVNVIPVDYVADAITRLTFDPVAAGMTFHLIAPEETLPTAEEVVTEVRAWAAKHLQLSLLPAIFVPPIPLRRRPSWLRLGRLDRTLDGLLALEPYFSGRQHFLRTNTDRLLGTYDPHWRELLPRLLEFAVAHGFMHLTGRTVHEQILFRLRSTSRVVTYDDIVEGQFHQRRAEDMHDEIEACVGALHSLGIGRGDRVAIVGLNSSRYLALDVAIGLVGAVSVPLYYTSPAPDIDMLVDDSRARLLLVGAPQVLERLNDLQTRLPIVSFCRQPVPPDLPRPVLSWHEFLDRGASQEPVSAAPVSLGDEATIRYTSGTTGRPKGVVFTHAQLRWMGKTMASLLQWQARTHPARYLSFLPMNHVVEGILATYGSYYVPASIRVSFLEDFHRLEAALPRVRPTIFFSVPRVYEKVWEGLSANPIGKLYIQLPRGLRRRTLRPLLRTAVMRRAGLDRCAQLIVGSAAVRESLLQAFHELGVEIYDAYGQTEAPLVTLNRVGANVIGTAGRPLPETEVHVAGDGEVLVRGPQVTRGYDDARSESPVIEGWLHTGDIGSLTGDGHLVIRGRKKEFIATSYGKKIFPAKVESLLRAVPGVDEAMVIGEGRPYCVALLWAGNADDADLRRIDQGVIRVDADLSHPEQIKRWAVLANDLSRARGDLTPKLDLRRQVVAQRLAPVIESLYTDGARAEGVLQYGDADTATVRAKEPVRQRRRSFKTALIRLAGTSLPALIKRRALEALFSCTAAAFDRAVPAATGRSYDERLRQYARFTRSETDTAIREHRDLDVIQARLYSGGYHLGSKLRMALHVTGWDEVMALSRMLYQMIDIDFEGTAEGEVTIPRCYFSRFYSGPVCRVISSLDAGLLAGLSGGGRLEFTERITEGCAQCRAHLTAPGRLS